MPLNHVSRRAFVMGSAMATLSASRLRASGRALTAQDVVDRIQANVSVAWKPQTVDGFKIGEPATVITGIATTAMASMDVLRRAAASHQNLVITQEPTFYTDDSTAARPGDPVHTAKREFIEAQRLVIWRFSDHWSARQPNEHARALASALGWTSHLPDADQIYTIPETTLAGLIAHVRTGLGLRGGLRVVGRPTLRVRTVFVSAGTTDLPSTMLNLRRADVVLSGEPREWEAIPYALDTWAANPDQGKGMIAIGRVVSEGPGMQACATWLRTLVPEVPVSAVTTADPYWSPAP